MLIFTQRSIYCLYAKYVTFYIHRTVLLFHQIVQTKKLDELFLFHFFQVNSAKFYDKLLGIVIFGNFFH